MPKSIKSCLIAALSITVASCSLAPVVPSALSEIECELSKRLPAHCSMSTFVEMDSKGHEVNVRDKLAGLGAYPATEGQICDRWGREIRFWRARQWGTPALPSQMAAAAEELVDLNKRYTVIILQHDPREPFVP